MSRFALSVVLVFLSIALPAQTTKVRGQVTEADTGEPIPFAGVFFKGTTTGVTTDLQGRYSMEIRDPQATVLVCQLLGYDTEEAGVSTGVFTTLDFKLRTTDNHLTGSIVKADNKRVRQLLRNIEANRDRNDPDRHPGYVCEIYNRMELDISHAREQLRGKRFMKEFGFVFDYMDTSVVSGVPYLPVMISESVVKRSHTSNPETDREEVMANQISGINKDNNLISQFTGNMYLKSNFYNDFVNSFGVEFPSPTQPGGLLYYNYYIIDSLQMESRKTYLVRYHPKKGISSPAFDGEMHIDAEDFAVRDIHARMVRGGNVNWIRDLVYDVTYERRVDSSWFFKSDKLYADFSIALSDSSKMMSFLGTRSIDYTSGEFVDGQHLEALAARVKVDGEANYKDEAYWESKRPYPLSEKERGIYRMVEAIKDQPLYQSLYTTVYTIVTGYLDLGPVGIGPYLKLVSFNDLEGFRPRIGIHTSKDLSQKWRWTVFGAYGTKDETWKGGLSWERIFSKEPTRKLTLDAHYDVYQIGRGKSSILDNNVLSSIFHGAQKISPMSSYSALYDHEFFNGFNAQAEIHLKRHFSNGFVPMVDWSGRQHESVAANEMRLQARFSRDETVNRGYFIKTYVHTPHPVLTFDLAGSVGGIRKDDWSYLRPEVTFNWRFKLPPLGISRLRLNAGTIIGQVPYPFLHVFAGNVTNFCDRTSFSTMDYFEYAADSWVSLFYDHNFHGFFLGKIPLLRKLQLREVVTLKAAWGALSDRNNGTDPSFGAVMRFPEGMYSLKVPYIELGVGITNILRLFRVDCVWRLTNIERGNGARARRPFLVCFGLDFSF